MTTFAVPPVGSPAWREIYKLPPDVKTGTWCPIDDTTLQFRPDGWTCPECKAAWNLQGRGGRWLPESDDAVVASVRWRPSAPTMLVGVIGCAVAGFGLATLLNRLDEQLAWLVSAVIALAAAAIPTYAWVVRKIEDFPYRHNTVHARPVRALPTDTGEVPNED
jgi:hypothetical protein